jgi:ribonuclease HII
VTSRRIIGIDEAGRGPILGPMALAAVALAPADTRALNRAGVSDSKNFGAGEDAHARRSELAELIRARARSHACVLVEVDEIDHYTFRGQLNGLERRVARDLLMRVNARPGERIICDGEKLFAPLRPHYQRLEAVDRGESVHVSVAAASILAKVARDEAFFSIARRYEPEFGKIRGGGYINAATNAFLDAYRQRYGHLPPEARQSWGAPKDEANLSLLEGLEPG